MTCKMYYEMKITYSIFSILLGLLYRSLSWNTSIYQYNNYIVECRYTFFWHSYYILLCLARICPILLLLKLALYATTTVSLCMQNVVLYVFRYSKNVFLFSFRKNIKLRCQIEKKYEEKNLHRCILFYVSLASRSLGQPLSNLLEIGSISFPLFVFLSINMSFSHFKIRMQGRFRIDRTCWKIL